MFIGFENLAKHEGVFAHRSLYCSESEAGRFRIVLVLYLLCFSYCIVFELQRVTKACQKDKDFYKMQQGELLPSVVPVAYT